MYCWTRNKRDDKRKMTLWESPALQGGELHKTKEERWTRG
jgi:hypothetical protein